MEYDQPVQSPIERDRSNYAVCLYFQSTACRFGHESYVFDFPEEQERVLSRFASFERIKRKQSAVFFCDVPT